MRAWSRCWRVTRIFGWALIELKYLARSEPADPAGVAAAVSDATAQLQRYLADERLARQFPGVRFTALGVVFHGWELAYCDAVA